MQSGNNDLAVKHLREAVSINKDNVSAQSLLCWALFHSGDIEAWSHQVESALPLQARDRWHDFDNYFLGYRDFYVDYTQAERRWDETVQRFPNWLFARLMKDTATAHVAWAGDPDASIANEALADLKRVLPLVPQSNLTDLCAIFICSAVLYCDPEANWEEINGLAHPVAERLDQRADYPLGTWCVLKFHELAAKFDPQPSGHLDAQAKARIKLGRIGSGFVVLARFEMLLANGEIDQIKCLTNAGDEVQLMIAMAFALNGETAEAVKITHALLQRNDSWTMRNRALWVMLLAKQGSEARSLAQQWLNETSERVERRMQFDLACIELVANPSRGLVNKQPTTAQQRLYAELTYGLLEYSQSNRSPAIEHLRASVAAIDDWEVNRYANAFCRFLERQVEAHSE